MEEHILNYKMILNGFGFLLGITLICVNLICPKRTRSNSGKYWEQDEDDLEIGKLNTDE